MYKGFGIDITIYDKQDKFEAYLVTFFLVATSGLLGLIIGQSQLSTMVMNGYRVGGIVLLTIIYIFAYAYYYITHKETLKLFLSAVSFGVLTGAFLFFMIVLVSDMDVLFLAIRMLAIREKFSVLSSYISGYYIQYMPPLVFLFIANIFRLRLRGKFNESEKTSGIYGSALFADNKYLRENNLINETKALFGRDINTDSLLSFPLCNRTVISKPGGGKTTGITIPALLTEDRPILVHDPKGELWATTARYRIKNFGRKIITIDPFKVTCQSAYRPENDSYSDKLPRHFINPLLYLPESDAYRDRFLSTLITSVVKSDFSRSKSEASDHFIEHTQILLGALLEFVIDIKNKESELRIKVENHKKIYEIQQTLRKTNPEAAQKAIIPLSASVMNLMDDVKTASLQDILDLLNQTIHDLTTDMNLMLSIGSVRQKQAAATFLSTGESERGSILSTTRRQLMWLADKNLRETFTQNTCDLKDFIRGEADIYIIMPEDQINTQSRCIRMILSLIQSLLIQQPIQNLPERQYLFLLDELGQLDYNPDIEQAIAILRGRKCVFWSIFQTYSQIEQYRKPDLFIDTGILQFFSIGDPKIMQLIQKLGGKQTKIIERNNHSQSTNKQWGSIVQANIGESNSNSVMEVQTDLIHLNEIRELPRDEQYVFIDGLRPIHCKKLKYYTDPFFKNYDNNPLESSGCK